ncbi:hypothetical protein IT568_11855 [bacterium]|nr:hypothetical protein [bacterium]
MENNKEATLLDFLLLLTKWKKFIVSFFLLSVVVTAIIVLIVPKWWSASTMILLPSEEKGFGALALAGINLSSLGFGGDTEALAQKYLAILNSRRLADSTIAKFNLQKDYELEKYEDVLKEFSNNVSFSDNGDGTLTITAFFKNDSLKAPEMANYIVNQLDLINKELSTEKARFERQFVEAQFQKQWEKLRTAEDSLKNFQVKNNLLEIGSQVTQSIEKTTDLQLDKLKMEIQYNLMGEELGISHPKVRNIKKQIDELQKQITKIEEGKSEIALLLPSGTVPEIGISYYRLRRDVELQAKIIEFLLPQVEQAKFQEAKDTPTLQVLDTAHPPEIRSKPKRTITVLIVGFASLILAILWVAIIENYKKLAQTSPESYEKVNEVAKNLGLGKYVTKVSEL